MAKQDDYIRITTRLPPELHDALVVLAKRAERSLNGELVATLQATLSMIADKPHPQTTAQEMVAEYQAGDVTMDLIKLIEALPKEKQRSLFVLLK